MHLLASLPSSARSRGIWLLLFAVLNHGEREERCFDATGRSPGVLAFELLGSVTKFGV